MSVLILYFFFVATIVTAIPKPYPLLFGHRGNSAAFPELSLPAFISCLELGCDVNELDIHVTADKQLVVFHDATIDRTTNGTGRVDSYTLQQLRSLDIGFRFTLDGGVTFPFRGLGLRVITVAELFQQIPYGIFNIDMKTHSVECAELLADEIERFGVQNRVIIGSFDDDTVEAFKRISPNISTLASSAEVTTFTFLFTIGLGRSHSPRSFSLQVPDGLTSNQESYILTANDNGQQVVYWTIDDETRMRELIEAGADGVMTNDVNLGARVFADYRDPTEQPHPKIDVERLRYSYRKTSG